MNKSKQIMNEQQELEYKEAIRLLNKLAAKETAFDKNPNHPTITESDIVHARWRYSNWRNNVCCDRVKDALTKRGVC